ncbi:DUF4429 domain-containing protein [Streptomyces sp. J2-1]|uniref:DUF4429 domain-containing protein n=1 Tax=Streptomyces corallincola TaxID=2851888 RepID=UPI001C3941BA|nr:DUF4429 domain-containing protein [Streptomyces corallincola]MBV2353785.1 DUF4429 domain-containing protein [Streptomyces corallincola]
MGDVLAGFHAVWEFGSDSVLIRYERGIRTPKLFQALGERRVPFAAIERVSLGPARRGAVALRMVPRAGADPLAEAAAGQLGEGTDPYRLVLPAERAVPAEESAGRLSGLLGPPGPADGFLVAAPEPPLAFKAYDGKASFDGTTVRFRWSWTGASSEKWKAGDRSFAVADLGGVEWRASQAREGHLRLLSRGEDPDAPHAPPDRNPAAIVFGLGYGQVHESLPFAAAVLEAVRRRAPKAAVPRQARRDPADIAERIRHLGELHRSGLVTDEEFSSKKAELLAEL